MLLNTEPMKIPLWFCKDNFDPLFLKMVEIVLIFANSGINVLSLILLNIISNDFFRSSPATSGLNISFAKPSGSLDLLFFSFFSAVSRSFEFQSGVLFSFVRTNLLLHSFSVSSCISSYPFLTGRSLSLNEKVS